MTGWGGGDRPPPDAPREDSWDAPHEDSWDDPWDTLTPRTVDRFTSGVATVAAATQVVNVITSWRPHADHSPVWLVALVLATLVVAGCWTLWATVAARAITTPLRLVAAVALVVTALSPFVERHPHGEGQPWQVQFWLLAAFAAVLSLPLRAGVPVSCVMMAGYVALREPERGWVVASLEVAVLLLLTQFAAGLVILSRVSARGLQRATVRRREQLELEARFTADEAARAWWVQDVHATVLPVLDAGVAVTPEALPDVRAGARAVLSAAPVRQQSTGSSMLEEVRRRATAAGVDLEIDVEVSGSPPPHVVDALTGALSEAVSNVRRHAGTHRAVLSGRLSSLAASLGVDDTGTGFDTAAIHRAGYGIHRGIRGRMSSVGGHADIRSGPDAGTTVALSWTAPPPEVDRSLPRAPFAWLLVPGVLSILIHAGLGLEAPHRHLWPALVGTAALLALLGIAARAEHRARLAWTTALLVPVVVGALFGNTWPDDIADYRTWMTGASVPPVVALAVVARRRAAMTAALLTLASILLAGSAIGYAVPLLLSVGLQVVLVPLFAVGAFGLSDRTAARRVAATRVALAAYTRSVELETRAERWARGVARIRGVVGPALDRLAEAQVADDAVRAACADARSALRLELAALDPALGATR